MRRIEKFSDLMLLDTRNWCWMRLLPFASAFEWSQNLENERKESQTQRLLMPLNPVGRVGQGRVSFTWLLSEVLPIDTLLSQHVDMASRKKAQDAWRRGETSEPQQCTSRNEKNTTSV